MTTFNIAALGFSYVQGDNEIQMNYTEAFGVRDTITTSRVLPFDITDDLSPRIDGVSLIPIDPSIFGEGFALDITTRGLTLSGLEYLKGVADNIARAQAVLMK